MAGLPFLYKSAGEHTGKALVMLPGGFSGSVFIAGPDGKPIQNLTKDTTRHVPEPGDQPGEFGQKWLLPKFGGAYGNNFLIGVTQGGKTQYVKIDNGSGEYRGHIDEGEGSLDKPAEVAPYGPLAGGTSGVPGQFAPGQVGQFGAVPAYIGNLFPQAVLAQYNPITAAKFNFTDPMKFAQEFGNFQRGEIQKNFDTSKDLALKELNTELSSLQNFVPAAAALKRSETSLDNQFNQAQRTQQINQVLPNAVGDLNAQAARARAFAAGGVPDSISNQSFEAGIRSAAADRAAAGGFGATSSVARKASDLLSTDQRIQLSRYGDQLLSSNINQSANLLLAPTEYSNAGAQVSVMPSVSASQLIDRNIAQINGLASIPATTALQSQVGQNQFQTNLQQQTNQFNATNQLQTSMFNAGAQNNFALDQFGYNANYAGAVAGASQANINTTFQQQQQQMFTDLANQYMSQAQNAQGLQSILSGAFSLLGGTGALGGLTNFGSGVKAGANGTVGPGGIPLQGAAQKGAGVGNFGSSIVSGAGDVISGIGSALGGVF